jgi:hypothetical protein
LFAPWNPRLWENFDGGSWLVILSNYRCVVLIKLVVAEHTKRALIVITSGELGTDVAEINNNLRTFLQYAATWKAVVLIDEADVFLEARQEGATNRMEQNGLVAGLFLPSLTTSVDGH